MMTTGSKATRVLYIDLDGTVRLGADERGGKFVNKADDVELFPGVDLALRVYKDAGWRLIAVSNQGGIALGIMPMGDCVEAMMRTQRLCGDVFDKITWCQHHPNATDPEYARCWCRKPLAGGAIGAALDLAKQKDEHYPPHMALFVGDRPEDEGCAANMNVMFVEAKIWRANWRSYLNQGVA